MKKILNILRRLFTWWRYAEQPTWDEIERVNLDLMALSNSEPDIR
jgi:hypothetical protein